MVYALADRQRHAETAARERSSPSQRPSAAAPAEIEAWRRLDHIRAVLETARAIVERGWLQHGWYLAAPQPRTLLSRLFSARTPAVDEVQQACLVAAVAVAAHGGGRADVIGDAGPMIDVVWHALHEPSGVPGTRLAHRAVPPAERVARMRDLVRWNDAAGRTRRDVLDLLDRSISRTIMTAMATTDRSR